VRSLRTTIMIKCAAALGLSAGTLVIGSAYVKGHPDPRGQLLSQTLAFQFDLARHTYETGGARALRDYLDAVARRYPNEDAIMTDAAGRDLSTGEDRSVLLARALPATLILHENRGTYVVAIPSADDRYRWIAVLEEAPDPWIFLAVNVAIVMILVGFGYSLVKDIASPIHAMHETLDRFGQGDLSARIASRRRDEIGSLARRFDVMAERIEVLVTAERRLLQDIAHELRSPLARLSMTVGMFDLESPTIAIPRLRREITRLSGMVNTLLDMTRAEGDPSARRFENVALAELCEEIADDCGVEASAKQTRLNCTARCRPILQGDPELVRRAVENVIRNAIRYSPPGLPIDMTVECGDGSARVSVRDYGRGVPNDMLSRIFQPFFRVDESRSHQDGTGLGLAIAQRAVRVHGGRIDARNAEPGLVVVIELPLSADLGDKK